MKIYRCQYCDFNTIVKDNDRKSKIECKHKLGQHYEEAHKDLLPPGMTGYRWVYYLLTKKDKGSCIMCHQETDFNEHTMKYARFCHNPMCKEKYRQQVDGRMINKYGKAKLLDDPDVQKKMLKGRRISGTYLWSDGKTKFDYVGSYELDFLRYLDQELNWPVADLMFPSPHIYKYMYEDKEHFYIPDAFIGSMFCEIEIKDDGSALKINKDSREKDKIKDRMMRSMSNEINYLKIINKNYTDFNKMIEGGRK